MQKNISSVSSKMDNPTPKYCLLHFVFCHVYNTFHTCLYFIMSFSEFAAIY